VNSSSKLLTSSTECCQQEHSLSNVSHHTYRLLQLAVHLKNISKSGTYHIGDIFHYKV
jgi:hypothetical protein